MPESNRPDLAAGVPLADLAAGQMLEGTYASARVRS